MNKNEKAQMVLDLKKTIRVEGILLIILLISALVFFILYAFTAAASSAFIAIALLVIAVGLLCNINYCKILMELYKLH